MNKIHLVKITVQIIKIIFYFQFKIYLRYFTFLKFVFTNFNKSINK